MAVAGAVKTLAAAVGGAKADNAVEAWRLGLTLEMSPGG